MEVWGDKIIMELNDAAKNGDVETAWDSSEVEADAGIEYGFSRFLKPPNPKHCIKEI